MKADYEKQTKNSSGPNWIPSGSLHFADLVREAPYGELTANMHVSKIQIANFRNFERFEIKLGPGLNGIVGENGVGKSNLLYALRLVLDSDLSSSARRLDEDDFFMRIGPPAAAQITISLEFSGFDQNTSAEATVGKWLQVNTNTAKLTYRFRPRPAVRQAIINGEKDEGSLTISDYGFERVGGTDGLLCDSILDSTWQDDFGSRVVDSEVQNYHFVELPALRDAVRDLRQVRQSPLARLLQTVELSPEDSTAIETAMESANKAVREANAISGLGKGIDDTYRDLTRGLNVLSVKLGLTENTIPAVLRTLSLLLTDSRLEEFEMSRNGLGFNNLLYAAVQIKYFSLLASKASAGQLLVIEEPEAHLHPHAQRNLIRTLSDQGFQIIVSSHSPELCGLIGIENLVALANTDAGTVGTNLVEAAALDNDEVADLNRYLDATRGAIFFARRTILVEGPAELYLVSAFAHIMGVDLAGAGVSVISVNGTNFSPFVKLYRSGLMTQKCAVIQDGDAQNMAGSIRVFYDDGEPSITNQGPYVASFSNKTTLEMVLLNEHTANLLRKVASRLRARKLERMLKAIEQGGSDSDFIGRAQLQVLRLAVRLGKARFAQLLSTAIAGANPEAVPPYIREAILWVVA